MHRISILLFLVIAANTAAAAQDCFQDWKAAENLYDENRKEGLRALLETHACYQVDSGAAPLYLIAQIGKGYFHTYEDSLARVWLEEALVKAIAAEDSITHTFTLHYLGSVMYWGYGDNEQAIEYFTEATNIS